MGIGLSTSWQTMFQRWSQGYDDIRSGRLDCGEDDRMLGGVTHQVMFPAKHDQRFAQHSAVAAARTRAWLDGLGHRRSISIC